MKDLNELGLNKQESALVERFVNLIKGNEIDMEMFDRLFRNVEDANALAILKNKLSEIAEVAPQIKETPKRNYTEKHKSTKKQVPMSVMAEKPKKESDKDIKQNIQDLGSLKSSKNLTSTYKDGIRTTGNPGDGAQRSQTPGKESPGLPQTSAEGQESTTDSVLVQGVRALGFRDSGIISQSRWHCW